MKQEVFCVGMSFREILWGSRLWKSSFHLQTVRNSAVYALLYFNKNLYVFPEHRHNILVSHIIAADALGMDHFLAYVGEKLCLPTTRFDMSNEREWIQKVVRDRYRLSLITQLDYPPRETCYVCKKLLVVSEIRTFVSCCNREFHLNCVKACNKCPYCREPWVGLRCSVCGRTCTPKGQFPYEVYATLVLQRMSCCSADVHTLCKRRVGQKYTVCSVELCDGYPVPTRSPRVL